MSDRAIHRILVQAKRAMEFRGYQPRTIRTYGGWIRKFVEAHRHRHPAALEQSEVVEWLTDLASRGRLSASSQGQATSAVSFFFADVLKKPIERPVLARRPAHRRLPVVLTRTEVQSVLKKVEGVDRLIMTLLYGSGLRLLECLTLRVKDVDLERREITIRGGKGNKDRVTMIPRSVIPALEKQVRRVTNLHQRDLKRNAGAVPLPDALGKKYPNAYTDLRWQFIFPSRQLSDVKECPARTRLHRHPSAVQRVVRQAARDAGLTKRVTCHTFRHSFATHLLANGYDIRTIQELLGHASVRTTMIYTHVLNRGGHGVQSPADLLDL